MSKLYVNEIVEANAGAGVAIPGHVIQVVSADLSSTVAFGTTTGTEFTLMTLNITPKYNTSKILVTSSIGMYMNSSANEVRGDFFLKRDSTLIRGLVDGSGVGYFRDSSGHFKTMSSTFNHLDSPATASQITYTLGWYGTSHAVSGTFESDYTGMTVMEIAQ